MNASKENARKALDLLEDFASDSAYGASMEAAEKFLREFLEAAEKELPSDLGRVDPTTT